MDALSLFNPTKRPFLSTLINLINFYKHFIKMNSHILPALRLTLASLLVFSGLYTLAVWGVAQALPNRGLAERVEYKGQSLYANIGQKFTDDRYFWSRPSAVDYNAAGSAGSNKGPSNPDYLAAVQARIDTFLMHNPGVKKEQIPADLVTASGSGLDPHISPEAALIQAARIARLRKLDVARVQSLVGMHTEQPWLGIFGLSRVNVLRLNIALDDLK